MFKIKFFLLSFICSLIFISTPVLADEEILIDNDYSIEEEIEEETQEEHIEDIEEVIEDKIEEDTEVNYDDFISDLMPIDEDFYITSQSDISDIKIGNNMLISSGNSSNNFMYLVYGKVLSLNPLIYFESGYYTVKTGTYTATNKIVYSSNNIDTWFRDNYTTLISTFSDGSDVSLDNVEINTDNTQIIDKLDSVLNTFYILVFIICTILGFLLAYIFVKVLFKI